MPKPGKARAVQIDHDPTRIGLRYDVEVGLVGDSRRSLEALLPIPNKKEDRSFLEKAQKGMKEWRELKIPRNAALLWKSNRRQRRRLRYERYRG